MIGKLNSMDIACVAGITVVALGLSAMFLNYKAKFDRRTITLEKNDQKQDTTDHEHQERIKKLEEKNGHELEEITKLRAKVETLEHIIKESLKENKKNERKDNNYDRNKVKNN